MASASVEPHSPKDKLPLAPEALREEVKKLSQEPVKLRHTDVVEKIVLPTEQDINIEKHQQCNAPVVEEVGSFNRKSLRHSETDEKNPVPSAEEYKQIKQEKQEFREKISHFDQSKLKHVTPEEKHDIVALDESDKWRADVESVVEAVDIVETVS